MQQDGMLPKNHNAMYNQQTKKRKIIAPDERVQMKSLFGIVEKYYRTHRLLRRMHSEGKYTYGVVCCVYNTAPYLNDLLTSLTEQTLDFEKHIQLIIVDDGSTDDSERIIHAWQQRYPKNISMIYKEHGGVSSARNIGLQFVKTDWVTYIDSDDFIDCTYFAAIDDFLVENHNETTKDKRIKLLACNYILYRESKNRITDSHPLRFRFAHGEQVYPCGSKCAIQLSVNSAILNARMVKKSGLLFDERDWKTFDDAHFVARFLHNGDPGCIAYADKPRYYYRKRIAKNSNIDLAHYRKESYTNVLREGCLELMNGFMESHGYVPYAVQWCILYYIANMVRKFAKGFPIEKILNKEQRNECDELIAALLNRIDDEVIKSFHKDMPGYIPGGSLVKYLPCSSMAY